MNAVSSSSFKPARFEAACRVGLLALALVLAWPATLWAHGYRVGDIVIGHPWSRATPAGAAVATGYMKLHNSGATPDRLISIQSDISDAAAVHEMAVDAAGVMTMRPLPGGLEIPAGGDVVLKPGAFHVMFTGLRQPLKAGARFPATLTFEKAGPVEVEFVIEAAGGAPTHDMKMDGMKMDGADSGG